MAIVTGLTAIGRPAAIDRAIFTTSDSPTRFSTIDASSDAWTVGLIEKQSPVSAGSVGRSRLMSLKFWLVPPANGTSPVAGSRCCLTRRTTDARVSPLTTLNPSRRA